MNVIWHDYIAFHSNMIVECMKLTDIFICDLAIRQQLNFRTVEDAGPYNAG